jgi:hypothetical protein
VDITYCNLTSFLYYKDIIRKAFFTMGTLLMPLLENGKSGGKTINQQTMPCQMIAQVWK